ncbi:Heavy metal tolerance protein [Drechslerella dactyloides]|uniref:Heavy metal tolerance protein n=1 Tax=Drechslerella dactyloides TaxID=74499 RepID=A0AAD6J3D5_DREDA|nr:Heavy metal tolerance protein [Drechslerella dactyloides]
MARLVSAGFLLVAFGLLLFVFAVTRLIQDLLANNELAIDNALRTIHYASPIVTFLYFIFASMMTVFTFKSLRKASHPKTADRKKLVVWLSTVITATYVLQGLLIILKSLKLESWTPTTHENVYVISSLLLWTFLQVSLIDSKYVIWYPYAGCWYISIVFELLLLLLVDLRRAHAPHLAGIVWLVIAGLRVVSLVLLPLLFYTLPATNDKPITPDFDEERGLLCKQRESGVDDEPDDNLGIYGAFFDTESDDERTKTTKAKLHAKWQESGNWWNYAKSFSVFWPMIWPSKNKKLRFYMFLISLILVGRSVLNLLVPRQFGLVTDSFLEATHGDGSRSAPWVQVSLFIVFRLLQSNAGLLALKDYLWIPVEQYSYRMITTSAYNHILSLSYDFHCDKRSGELFASISNARSINLFIDMMLFSFVPMLVDLFIAFVYLYYLFGPYMALLVAFVTISFLWSTSKMALYNQTTRRDFIKASRKEGDTMWETVSNWQNISYFNNLEYEQNKYMDAVLNYQGFERKCIWGASFLKVIQSLLFTLGLLGACYLAVYAILEGTQPVGSFVTLLLYWTQLSDFFRRLNTSMIDAERVLEILSLKPSVSDSKNASKLQVKDGEVVFDGVNFSYDDRKPALRGISFNAKPGQTIAIVGETGSGKSTIMRLLFRFYDVKRGSIKIDGQDIRDVTLNSLRDAIGVVPQDPTLFNDTIMNNLRYANFSATDLDIYKACKAAAIHEQIEDFPDGYDTIVGERGVKLSGGQLQRIAIARAIIKNPKIILLDEATSMVDMYTERRIQSAFSALKKERTTFVIAHRLSTIINADQIVVVEDGKIVEVGTHAQLLKKEKAYHSLWNKQVRQNTLAEESDKTNKLKTLLVNDLLSPVQTGNNKKANVTSTPTPLVPTASTNTSTTTCQPPQLHKPSSTTNVPAVPHIDSNTRAIKPTSLPHYNYTMPNLGKRPSTLKPDAPEYIPSVPGSMRLPLVSFCSASTRNGKARNNGSWVKISTMLTEMPQAASGVTELKRGPEISNESETGQKAAVDRIQKASEQKCQKRDQGQTTEHNGDTPNGPPSKTAEKTGIANEKSTSTASGTCKGSDSEAMLAGGGTKHDAALLTISNNSQHPETSQRALFMESEAAQSLKEAANAEEAAGTSSITDIAADTAKSESSSAAGDAQDRAKRPRFRFRPRRNHRGNSRAGGKAGSLPTSPQATKSDNKGTVESDPGSDIMAQHENTGFLEDTSSASPISAHSSVRKKIFSPFNTCATAKDDEQHLQTSASTANEDARMKQNASKALLGGTDIQNGRLDLPKA